MPTKPRPSTRSSNPKTARKHHPGQEPGQETKPARGQRRDTPEGKTQKARVPKTHPTRNPVKARKDK
jgi:hypothetical protein